MSNEVSLVFYLVSFLASAYLLSFGIRRKIGLFIFIALLIPIIMGGFRYNVGTDYPNYVAIYSSRSSISLQEFVMNNGLAETLFFILEKISYIAFDDPRLMFLVSVALSVVFFYAGLKRLNPSQPVLIYFLYLTTLFPMTLNVVRQGIAVSIVFFASTYIIKRQPIRYSISILAASTFHISSLLTLPVYFLGSALFKKRKNITTNNRLPEKTGFFVRVFFISALTAFICLNVFSIVLSIPGLERYELYTFVNEEGNNYIFFVKLLSLITIVVLCKYTVFESNRRINKFFLTLAIMELILLTLGFVSPFIKREALYFSPFILLLLPNIASAFQGRVLKYTIYTLILLYGTILFTVSHYLLGQSDIIPYNFSLEGEI